MSCKRVYSKQDFIKEINKSKENSVIIFDESRGMSHKSKLSEVIVKQFIQLQKRTKRSV